MAVDEPLDDDRGVRDEGFDQSRVDRRSIARAEGAVVVAAVALALALGYARPYAPLKFR